MEGVWRSYAARDAAPTPYRLHMSLRFGTEGDTRRVTALFWGNGRRQMRLDVMAGVGATVAKILEDGQHFLIYSPGENKAYFYQGAAKPLLQVGVPLPFGLENLADLLNGRYARAFGSEYLNASMGADGTASYALDGGRGGSLTLDARGLPTHWVEHPGGKGWRMELLYSEDGTPQVRRLNLEHSNGKRAVLLVKEREAPVSFSEEQMSLSIPDSAPLLPLAQFKQPR